MEAAASNVSARFGIITPMIAWLAAVAALAGLVLQSTAGAAVDSLEREIRTGSYGNVDRLWVSRRGRVVVDARFPRDYDAISRDRRSPIGCGAGCPDSSWMHEFNYFHPDWHPYFRGRDVHTLQSVTK
jgi:hypothetical protein